ncbi:zinc ribbon domain-containing protein [Alteromonas sp. McT4-15]
MKATKTGKFVTISCLDCGFSELYKRQRNTTGTLLDFFF